MRIATFFINIGPNERKTFFLKHADDEILGFISCPRSVDMKVEIFPGLWSYVKRPFMIDEFNTFLPVFAKSKRGVRVVVEVEDNLAYDYAAAIFYKEAEVKDLLEKKIYLHVRAIEPFEELLEEPGKLTLYTHKETRRIYLLGIIQDLGGIEETRYKLYKNEEELADFVYFPFLGISRLGFLPLQTTLEKDDTLTLEVIKPASDARARMHLLCALNEVKVEEIPFLNQISPVRPIPPVDEDSDLIEIPTPQPVPPPPVPPDYPPYPPTLSEVRDIFAPSPPTVDPYLSSTQKPKEIPQPVSLVRDDETKVVQVMLSPWGGVRATADARGRQRVTDASISYAADKLQVTDTSEYTLFKAKTTKGLSFYAKKGNWQIKILTLYDQLSQRKITDMDSIYLDEGQAIEIDIEAVQVNAACENATTENPGILYWEAEL